jgi:hypothetical protein
MIEGNWIEVTGLANATYLQHVLLPACERRAAQAQVLAATADTRTSWWRALPVRRWLSLQRHSGQELVGRTTTVLPDA